MSFTQKQKKDAHSDFSKYWVVEEGDPQAKDALKHMLPALAAFKVLLGLKSKNRFRESLSNLRPIVIEGLINAGRNLPQFRNEEKLKVFTLGVLEKSLEIIDNNGIMPSKFEHDKKMVSITMEKISKNLGKEINYDEALLIYTLILVEANYFGKAAEAKRILNGKLSMR